MKLSDPRIAKLPVIENNEPLIDFRHSSQLKYGPSPEIPNNQDYTKLRKSVLEKVIAAESKLGHGLRFCIYEGYRSLATQELIFNSYSEILKKSEPELNDEQLYDRATQLVSPLKLKDGTINLPPHNTGAAVDLYLIDENGEALDMGIHPADWMQDLDGSISLTASTKISAEAQHNREIMSRALSAVGMVNYVNEYWHWSYGDKCWAYYKQKPHAIYGAVS